MEEKIFHLLLNHDRETELSSKYKGDIDEHKGVIMEQKNQLNFSMNCYIY
jgi:hypothetical protein